MSSRYDWLGPRFFGVDLERGEMILRPGHTVTMFLIVEHSDDEAFIRKESLQLLMTGRDRWFHFYGKQKQLWYSIMKETDALLHSIDARKVNYDNIDDFVSELDFCIHARTFVPNDVFLLYDDASLYHDVMDLVMADRYIAKQRDRKTIE